MKPIDNTSNIQLSTLEKANILFPDSLEIHYVSYDDFVDGASSLDDVCVHSSALNTEYSSNKVDILYEKYLHDKKFNQKLNKIIK